MPRVKKPWYKDPIKLNWIFISIATLFVLLEVINLIELSSIRNDLFNYYLWP